MGRRKRERERGRKRERKEEIVSFYSLDIII